MEGVCCVTLLCSGDVGQLNALLKNKQKQKLTEALGGMTRLTDLQTETENSIQVSPVLLFLLLFIFTFLPSSISPYSPSFILTAMVARRQLCTPVSVCNRDHGRPPHPTTSPLSYPAHLHLHTIVNVFV